MSAENEVLEAPNWLSELEKKRENRVKARLGHEAGAGAPCLKCVEGCPGLDLHFWRKICKNCKCLKEDHDVHDDDIYGWAQFQLLGSKPNKIKTKIVLPGKKEEVELDWAPKGPHETIERYLKTLPPESLPVKGSEAAQARKQLLQKQIPIHDIDPSLCHDLTDTELKQMHDYIEHMKVNSVGVGQIIEVGHHYGQLHTLGGKADAAYVSDRYPLTGLQTVDNVENQAANLAHTLGKLAVNDQRKLDDFFDIIPVPANIANNANFSEEHILNNPELAPKWHEVNRNLPNYTPTNINIYSDQQNQTQVPKLRTIENETNQNITNVRDLAQSTFSPNRLHNYNPSNQQGAIPEQTISPEVVPIGVIKDITYETPIKQAHHGNNQIHEPIRQDPNVAAPVPKQCRKCTKPIGEEFAVFVERSNSLYHSECFKCAGCNQNLADMVYFYDQESDEIYCGRDYAKIRGIPRCRACDELIFVKEYCLAENSAFHLKHFCCFECDEALAGQNYVVEEAQPLCLPCFEKVKASRCEGCMKMIKPDEQGANLNGVHFHADDRCFACKVCKKGLLGAKLLLRNRKLYCSHDCYQSDAKE